MTESQRQEFARDYTEVTEDGLIFKPRVDKLRAAINHEKGYKEGYKVGFQKGQHKRHVDCLLQLLRDKGIELGPEDVAALRRARLGELPNMGVAMDARDANHFMQQAGLR